VYHTMGLSTAVLGVGRAGIHHVHAYAASDNVSHLYLCDRDQELIDEVTQKYDISGSYTELEDLLEQEEIDAISISTPAKFHFEHATTCLNSGVNVLLEKPMVSSVEEANRLQSALEKSTAKLTVVHNEKFTPGMQSLYRRIHHLKPISHVRHTRIKSHSSLIKDRDHWVHELKGGYWGEVMPHRIYTLYGIVGDMVLKDVQVKKFSDRYQWFKADHVNIVLDSDYGPIHLHLARKKKGHTREYNVYGAEKKATATYVRNKIQSYDGDTWEAQYPIRHQLRNTKEFISSNKIYYDWGVHRLRNHVARYIPQIERESWIEGTLDKAHRRFIREYIEFLQNNRDNPVGWEEAFATLKLSDEICEGIDNQTNRMSM